jgi:hypothetical protein
MKQPPNPPQLNRRLITQIFTTFVLLVFISFSAYRALHRSAPELTDSAKFIDSLHKVQPIPIYGEIAENKAEISGMAWYRDLLVLLPQYPYRMDKAKNGKLFAISKADILSFLDGRSTDPLIPTEISIDSQIYKSQIKGFEGFEAIKFNGEQAYLTIEASNPMRGYLVTGKLDPDLMSITMNPNMVEIPPQAKIDNFADEALALFEDKIYTFYEANGVNDNPHPIAHTFDLELEPLESLPMTNIEYRVTDASAPDANGYFWVMNYFFWGDLIKIKPGPDQFSPGIDQSGILPQPLERLVQLRITEKGIIPGDQTPLRLALSENGSSRNWEALAALDDRGFLVATDKYPDTILAFISR